MNLLIFLVLFNLQLLNSELAKPRASSGGCVTSNNKLYYLGGKIFLPEENKYDNNLNMYELDLESGFTLKDGIAPWETIQPTNETPEISRPSTFYLGEESNQIIIYSHPNLYKYDINYKSWTSDNLYKNIKKLIEIAPNKGHPSYEMAYITQNDLNKNEFIIANNLKAEVTSIKGKNYNKLIKYNAQSNKLTSLDIKIDNQAGFRFFLNGKYCFIGGRNEYKGRINNENLIMIDIKTKKKTTQKLSGKIPKGIIDNGSTVIDNNKLYFTSYLGLNDRTLYVLDLNTFKWDIGIENFSIDAISPCIASFNNHILFSFGLEDGEGKLESSARSLIIDTKQWEIVDKLPPLNLDDKIEIIDDNKTNELNAKNNEAPTGVEEEIEVEDDQKSGDDMEDDLNNNDSTLGSVINSYPLLILLMLVLGYIIYKLKFKRNNLTINSIKPTNAKLKD